jgi:hypothetical protein
MATKSVAVEYAGGSGGSVTPGTISVVGGDKVDFTADGSKVTITFPDYRVFGIEYISVSDGMTETATVQQNPPTGMLRCPVHCEEVEGGGETTPDLNIGVAG